jgi:mono/diheme cytochrome c family protein
MNLYSLILGYVVLALGLVAVFAILVKLGRTESNKKLWLWVHRISGYAFFVGMTLLFAVMLFKVIGSGSGFSALTAIHVLMGLAASALIIVKWSLVRPFRGQMKLAPATGIFLIVVTFISVNLSSTIPLLGNIGLPEYDEEEVTDGSSLFEAKCGRCHNLERVYARDRNEEENRFLVKRMQAMDPEWISDDEAGQIIKYLNTGLGKNEE